MGVLQSVQKSSASSSSRFSPAPAWALHELQFLQEISSCSSVGSSPQATVWYLLPHCLLHRLQGMPALVPRGPPSLRSFLTLVFMLLFLTFFPLIPLLVWCFHKGAARLVAGLSCVLQCVLCGASWDCLWPAWGNSSNLPSLLPKP